MKQGIVVCTWSKGLHWANLCLDSLSPLIGKYPIYLAVNDVNSAVEQDLQMLQNLENTYKVKLLGVADDSREVGAMQAVLLTTDLDEFWLFQDTVEIIDTTFITESFEGYPDVTVSYAGNFMQFYLGKWQTNILCQLNLKAPKDKLEAIKYEHVLSNEYVEKIGGYLTIDPVMSYKNRGNYIDSLFDEERFAIVARYLIKRISLVKENFRVEGLPIDNPQYLTEEEIINWKKGWRRMCNG